MIGKIRTLETQTSEVYVDVNDLIIELLLEVDRCESEPEKEAYRSLVTRLTEMRDKGHKRSKRDGTKSI